MSTLQQRLTLALADGCGASLDAYSAALLRDAYGPRATLQRACPDQGVVALFLVISRYRKSNTTAPITLAMKPARAPA